jgi:hypothetical protein
MNRATIAFIIGLVEEAAKEAPQVISDLQSIFSKPDATPADWLALREKVLSKSYKDFVPDSKLP